MQCRAAEERQSLEFKDTWLIAMQVEPLDPRSIMLGQVRASHPTNGMEAQLQKLEFNVLVSFYKFVINDRRS